MRTVFISVWHGWRNWYWKQDKWASYDWVNEFDFITPIVDALFKLKHPWINLVRVPTWTLQSKINFINKNSKDWDLAIELHLDSARDVSWCSTWYYWWSDYAYRKAIQFQLQYSKETNIYWRWVHPDTKNRLWRLWFVRDTKPLALLVELWFIQSKYDLDSIKTSWAQWILSGIYNIIK